MKTLAVTSKRIVGATVTQDSIARKILLACGILFSVVHFGADIFSAASLEGYSYINQAVSELSAIGAPTRPLLVVTGLVIDVLLIAFAAGIWLSAGPKRSLRTTAILVASWGLIGLPGSFFSMHERGTASLTADVGHLVLTSLTVLLILLSVGFASNAGGRGFRIFSIAMIMTMLVFGVIGAPQASAVAAGQPTPWLGLIERVNFYAPGVWALVLAVILLRMKPEQPES